MDVEDDAVYAKRYDDDMEISGSDKIESEKMANDDWDQLGETSKGKSNRENFVRDTAKTYEKAKRSDYVRESAAPVFSTGNASGKSRSKRGRTGRSPRPHRLWRRRSRGQDWAECKCGGWGMTAIQAVHYYLKKALGELSEVMGEMQNVKSYQYAQLSVSG